MKQTEASRQASVIKSLRAADLKLLQADKEGGFVLAPTAVYREKAGAAVTSNFQVTNVKLSKVKAAAGKLWSIPAPVIFGGILDQTCLSWHQPCAKSGNCVVHENEGMSRGLFYALAVILSINMMCYYASLIAHRH
ncbi:hypothetical protein MTO96_026763 [Rhipicephalus appendiculatus]